MNHAPTGAAPETTLDTDAVTYVCLDCEDAGTTELRDLYGRVIAASYCSCERGTLLRYREDHAAADVIKTANDTLRMVSWETLQRVRAGLLALSVGDPS